MTEGTGGSPHHLVMIAVKIAFEAEDFLAAGKRTGQAKAMHRGFGAGAGEADKIEAGNGLAKQIGKLCMLLVFVGTGSAAGEGGLDGGVDAVVAMAEEGRTVRATEVDVLTVIEIPKTAAGGAVEIQRMAEGLIDSRGGGDARRQVAAGDFELLSNAGHRISTRSG